MKFIRINDAYLSSFAIPTIGFQFISSLQDPESRSLLEFIE